ncbi:VOC family protein [Luteimicrobium sp. NPDC057192]|uniref:VOC family protein n=1 Tax=Luteimicrobium sp. NPDC057192 TaxID=3346042 RepID=UPI00364427E9
MGSLTGIDHLVLTVADVDASAGFYERLGLRHETFGEGRHAVVGPGFKLNLHPADGAPIEPRAAHPTPGGADVCLVFDGPLDEVVALLGEAGLPVELGPVRRTGARGPMTSVYVRDPDRNLVELCSYEG